MFKYWCKARGQRTEEANLKYAVLAQVVRDGGFMIPVVMRLGAIPGHGASHFLLLFPSTFEDADEARRDTTVLTAIFSTLGMGLWTFLGAAVLGLPKQLAVVYIGASEADPGEPRRSASALQ